MVAEIPNAGRERREAPYAPPTSVVSILRRYRERGLPQQLTVEAVQDMGINKVDAYRTLAALQHLGFLDEENHPQPIFHQLRTFTDDEYRAALAERLRRAYPLIFERFELGSDPEERIRDHFRLYDPPSQTPRQYALFRGLAIEAGLVEGRLPNPRAPRGSGGTAGRPSGSTPQNRTETPPPPSQDDLRRLLAETLIEKIREVDAGDRESITWYLEQVKKLTESEGTPKKQEQQQEEQKTE